MRLAPPLLALFLLSAPLCVGSAFAVPPTSSTAIQDLVSRGEYDEATSALRKDQELFPYNDTLRLNLASTYALIAQREMKLNRFREAAGYFEQACDLAPDNLPFSIMRGIALYLAKDPDAAKVQLESAGSNAMALTYLGRISYDAGDLSGALEVWRRAQELEPDNEAVRELLEKATREQAVESRMDKGYSSMFDVTFDAELPPGFAAEVMDALESAYATVGSDLETFPRSRVAVILYTKSDYRSVTLGPDWSGGLYDGKIRLPIGGISHLTPQLRAVIFHEYTHVLIHELTRDKAPVWLNEGLAEIEGRRQFDTPMNLVQEAAQAGRLPTLSVLSGSFLSLKGSDAGLAYQSSYSLANFMVNKYGWYPVRQILKSLGEGQNMDSAASKALQNWGAGLPDVVREWKASLGDVAAQ